MELNREQIIKALECCSTTGDCPKCLYNDDTSLCINRILKDALSLIKELTEENESLKQSLDHEHASFMEIFGQYGEKCDKLAEENERLHASCKELTQKCVSLNDAYEFVNGIVLESRADTVRKMQERIKAEKFHHKNFGDLVYLADIDQIAKEMLEGV